LFTNIYAYYIKCNSNFLSSQFDELFLDIRIFVRAFVVLPSHEGESQNEGEAPPPPILPLQGGGIFVCVVLSRGRSIRVAGAFEGEEYQFVPLSSSGRDFLCAPPGEAE